jgi:hypothetical protein
MDLDLDTALDKRERGGQSADPRACDQNLY